jgi:hypothetical protein
LKIKRRIALAVGVVMAFAFFIFARGVILIAEDFKRPDVPRGENTVGLIIVLILAGLSLFSAYRFLSFFAKKQPGL